MMVYADIIDDVNSDRKTNVAGQMSLFEFVAPEEEVSFTTVYPDISEYSKEELLGYEKEVLGIYVSGHPLDEYRERMENNVTRTAADFVPDEETGYPAVRDDESVVIGGMIIDKKIITTKKGQLMAFLTIEDLYGTVEVTVFDRTFARCKSMLDLDAKVFVTGHAKADDYKT